MARPREEVFGKFISWVVSTRPMREAPGGGRAFRERTRWCWNVPVPQPGQMGAPKTIGVGPDFRWWASLCPGQIGAGVGACCQHRRIVAATA